MPRLQLSFACELYDRMLALHSSPTVLPLLKKISIENNTTKKTLGQLLVEGEIDATLGTSLPDEIRTDPDVVTAISELRRGRQGYLQAQEDLPDHTPGGDQEECLRALSVRRH